MSISLGTRVRMLVSLCGMATHYSRTGSVIRPLLIVTINLSQSLSPFIRGRTSDQSCGLRITNGNQRLRVLRTAVFVEQVIDVRTGAFERTVARWNIGLQFVHAVRGFGTVIDLNPDAFLLGNHFALAVESTAAGAIAHV